MTQKTLEQLMLKARAGNKAAYSAFLTEVSLLAKSYLAKRMPSQNDLEDVIQDVLISVHKAAHTWEEGRPIKPWLFSIIRFRFNDHLRAHYRHRDNLVVHSEVTENFFATPDVTEANDFGEEVLEALQQLPQKQRRIVEMMKIEGYSATEVAEAMNMSESAVKVSAHRSYKKLKALLIEAEKEAEDKAV